jgi:hypothetical protein
MKVKLIATSIACALLLSIQSNAIAGPSLDARIESDNSCLSEGDGATTLCPGSSQFQFNIGILVGLLQLYHTSTKDSCPDARLVIRVADEDTCK